MPRTRERYWYLAESTMLNSDMGDYYRVKSESALPPCNLVWTIERCPDGVLPSPQVLNIHSEKLSPPSVSKSPVPQRKESTEQTTSQAGMRLESKIESISQELQVPTKRIVQKRSFLQFRPYSGQSAAWFGSAHEESDAHKCRDRFEAPRNRHRSAYEAAGRANILLPSTPPSSKCSPNSVHFDDGGIDGGRINGAI